MNNSIPPIEQTYLTNQTWTENIPQTISMALGDIPVKGSVRCRRCHKALTRRGCACGESYAYISLYWQRKHYRFFKSIADGMLLDVQRGISDLTSINTEIRRGKFNPADHTEKVLEERKFDNRAEAWLLTREEARAAGELSPETLKNDKGYVFNYYIPFFGGLNVREIDFPALTRFRDHLRAVKVIKTRKNILNGLKVLFRWLLENKYIERMPDFPQIKGNNSRKRRALTCGQQLEALGRIPVDHQDIFEFGFETGLRPGETTALRVSDLNMRTGEALIQRTWSGPHLRETVKEERKLNIPLSDRALEIAAVNIRDKLPAAFLFINRRTGRRYTVKMLNQVWRKYSGFDCDHYSASRHSFCTQIVRAANEFDAQRLMRHADIRSTRVYYHEETDTLRDAVNRRSGASAERLLNESKTGKNPK